MTSKDSEPQLVYSDLCQDMMVDGERFSVSIVSSDQDPSWCLEIIDKYGTSHVWDAPFETDAEAMQAAMIAFDEEGAAGLLDQETNVVPFPKDSSSKGADDR